MRRDEAIIPGRDVRACPRLLVIRFVYEARGTDERLQLDENVVESSEFLVRLSACRGQDLRQSDLHRGFLSCLLRV